MELNTKTFTYSGVTVEVRRSKVKDALKRDLIRRALEQQHPDPAELDFIGAFARAVTQTVTAQGLGFDPTAVTPSNAEEAYQQMFELDENLLTGWYSTALQVNAPIESDLAPGVDTDSLKKKKEESPG